MASSQVRSRGPSWNVSSFLTIRKWTWLVAVTARVALTKILVRIRLPVTGAPLVKGVVDVPAAIARLAQHLHDGYAYVHL